MKTVKEGAREAGLNSETASVSPLQARRPRRNVLHRNVGYHNGILWTEEKELKKALYASLQDSKKPRCEDECEADIGDIDEEDDLGDDLMNMAKIANIKKRNNAAFANGRIFSEDNQNANPKRLRAQRKFAQGSNPSSPSVTPVKLRNSVTPSMDLLPVKRPKTEDFLTFLCLRGTSILPSSLDYFGVASKNDLNCEFRCQSPVSGDSGDRQKPQTKVQGARGAMKARGRPQSDKSVKTRPSSKASLLGEDFGSSSDSIETDSDSELEKKRESCKSLIFEGTRRRTAESDGHVDKSVVLERGGLLSDTSTVSTEPKAATCVQALKQKYRQQRLAKQKETLVKAKKTDLTTDTCENHKVVSEKPTRAHKVQNSSPVKAAEKPPISKAQPAKTRDVPRGRKGVVSNATPPAVRGTNTARKSGVSKLVTSPKMAASSAADKHKPVTRHASMLLQAAQERKEKSATNSKLASLQPTTPALLGGILPKKTMKTKTELVPVISKIEKHIPQLTSEHSYVKRLPASKESSPKPDAASQALDRQSDFSSDDDEPLVKKQRKQPVRPGRKPGADPKPAAALPKDLRSSREAPAVEDPPKTAAGRPFRKTKEVAAAYLEMLGEEDDFEPPLRRKTQPKTQIRMPVKKADPGNESMDTSTSSSSTASSSPSTDPGKLQKLGANPAQADAVKTRDFMKRLSEAQFKLAKSRGGLRVEPVLKKASEPQKGRPRGGGAKVNRNGNQTTAASPLVLSRKSAQPCKDSAASLLLVSRKSAQPCKDSAASPLMLSRKSAQPCKDPASKKAAPLCKPGTRKKVALAQARQPRTVGPPPWDSARLRRKEKKRKKRSRQSSGSSSSSYSMPVPVKRGPGRVPAMHALRRYPTSSSDTSTTSESSSSSTDYPSKPESTTISVRQNVPSASVAVQVNLLNDISDLDDDFWEPGFLDADIEGLFSPDRVVTPTLCKGASPCRLLPRSSWEPDGTPPSLKAGASTPTKRMTPTPEKADAAPKARTAQRPLAKGSPSSSPFHLKRSSPSSKRSKLESSDDDSGEFLIPLLASSGVKDAPIFYPTAEEFQDPFQYIEKVRPVAERFGVCKIIPPPSFKPDCKVNDDMRFTAHNQYVHKMLHRWGPNAQQLAIIRKHLEDQGVEYDQPPLIGGMELDLPRLFQTVQKYGGLKEVIEKQKWQKVADYMKIGKSAQDRVTKLYDAYCKFLLPYDTLSKDEKSKLEQQLRAEKQRKKGRFADMDECVTQGRSMSLSSFFRIARNTMAMWFKNDPKPTEVEQEYWRIVNQKQQHVCVNAGNIDSSTYGCGFNCNKTSAFAKHPWNLKVLTNNNGSVLRCMGPVMGITIPTLHVGMLFTTGCWYRDPHCLPWIEYLHTGASKIWYGIPASQSWKFRDAMNKIVPDFCADTPIWLPSDTAMVPPNLLVENGVSLCRLVQNSGQFVVVFPRAFTSTICCGYTISESVYFSGADWLEIAPIAFKEIADSREPAVFSLQQLLFSIANDSRVSVDVLQQILPLMEEIRDKELSLRKQLYELGLKQSEHLPTLELKDVKRRWAQDSDNDDPECETCRANCYVSMVVNTPEKTLYCLPHAVENLQKRKKDVKCWKLLYKYDQAELNEMVRRTSEQLQVHSAKKKSAKKSAKPPP